MPFPHDMTDMVPIRLALHKRITSWFQPRSAQAAIRQDVFRLALPAMGEQMLSMMVGIVDTYLVGHLGAASLAAVGLANQWVFMATMLFGAIATGATALIARFVGAREKTQANEVLRQSMLLGAGIGVFATVMGFTLAEPAVRLLGAEEEVVTLSASYLRVVSSIFFFSTLMFIGNASMRGAGDTRTPLLVMGVVANLSEISYRLASFDLSFLDADGKLICVDTISVSVLKAGQERAFRDSIRCPGYAAGTVASHQLQFAGGY